MPAGADAVVMVEETEKDDEGRVRIFSPVYPGQNVGRQGADIQAGHEVLHAGDYLTSSRVGAIAALGISEVEVFARPRVAMLSTGNEIVEPGRPLPPGQIYDINRFTLSAIVEEHGGVPVPRATSADRSRTSRARSTGASPKTSSSSRAEARSASAISCSTSSPAAARSSSTGSP